MSAPTLSPITAVVPARNEEQSIETAVRSLAAQPEIAEIRVVNDGSSDHTAEILARLSSEIPRLRVIEAGQLPSGWVGKNYAAWLGAQDPSTEWLLFTDADVRHLTGSAASALANARGSAAVLVSFSPRQVLETWWERALLPFVFSRLAAHYPYGRVNDRRAAVAAANGQYLLIRREAYQAIGGHRAVASDVLEDVALARRVKAGGFALYFAPGDQIAQTRMYRSFSAMWEGWTKNLYPLVGASPLAAAAELLGLLPIPELACLALAFVYPIFYWGVALLLLSRTAAYYRSLSANRFPKSSILYWVPGMALYCAALAASAGRHANGTIAWKGRTYPVGS